MALNTAANMAEFEQLIAHLMSEDNNVRGASEKTYNTLKQAPDTLVVALMQLIRTASSNDAARSLCVVLLRPLLAKSDDCWGKVSAPSRAIIFRELLFAVEQEKNVSVRHKLCSAIAELGGHTVPNGEWSDLLPFMFKCTRSDNEDHRESALMVFSDLAAYMGDQFRPHFNLLKDILTAGLTDPHSFKVRVAALAATANFLQILSQPQEKAMFQQLTPLMLETVNAALSAQKDEEAQNALELFVELAEAEPTFFRHHIQQVVDNMLLISSSQNIDESSRHMAIEVLLTLVEQRPGMMRKVPNFLPRVLQVIVQMMLTIEDESLEEWNNAMEEDETDITDYEVAEEALDRLAIELGGKQLVPVLFQNVIPQLLANNSDWRQRHCGLMMISLVGEGCHKDLVAHLASVVQLILPRFQDAHPRVRWAACNCAGQMATDFSPSFQKQFHAQLLPALAFLMDDTANPRVQAHAASAVINFCEDCKISILDPYLDGLLSKLNSLLQGGKIIVQEQAITAIAAIADCISDKFLKYYDLFMPFLRSILVNANNKEYRKLRGKTMECISLIGGAVGKEKFANDAKDVMGIMMQTQAGNLDADDPQITFMQQSWARICKCLGPDFVPFLPCVMPSLLQSASAKTDLTIVDVDEDVSDKEGWDFVTFGDKQVGINTSTLEEKSTACHMLYLYASELRDGFFPYVPEVAKIMIPLLKFFYHDGVRTAAVYCVPALLHSASDYIKKNAAQGADMSFVKGLFSQIYESLQEGIKQEMDLEILYLMLEGFAECLDVVGENALDAKQLTEAKDCVQSIVQDYAERMQEHAANKKGDDVDDEEEEKIDEEVEKDEECLGQLAEVVGRLAKYHKTSFLTHFKDLIPTFIEMLQPTRKAMERQLALCIVDDIVEYTGRESLPLFQYFLPPVVSYIDDPHPGVRQAAVYGVGVFGQTGGELFVPCIPDVLGRLNRVISAPDARSEDNVNPTENAISSVGKICEAHAASVDLATVLPHWLSFLPVTEDKVESRIIYNQLCTFIEKAPTQILGQSYQHLPKVVSVFASALGTDLVDEALTARIIGLLKRMQTQLPADVLQGAWSALAPDMQARLGQLMM